MNLVHEGQTEPYKKATYWATIQEEALSRILRFEGQILELKKKAKELKLQRQNPNIILTKTESRNVKKKSDKTYQKIEEYHSLIILYKTICDCIVFTFMNKWDVKPLNFKQAPGFITGKQGFENEIAAFRYVTEVGGIGVLNDLTNVLKYNDLTFFHESKLPLSIEMKSSKAKNNRTDRQSKNAETIFKYLDEDQTDNLYGVGPTIRVAMKNPEVNYVDLLNELVAESKSQGYSFKSPERGLIYFCTRSKNASVLDLIGLAMEQQGIEKPLAHHLNEELFDGQAYFPLALNLKNPEDYYDFLQGKMVLMVFMDEKIVQEISLKYDLLSEFVGEDLIMFKFTRQEKPDDTLFAISSHLIGRIFREFQSPRWLINESLNMFQDRALPS